jgi:hypothetical protein
LGDENIEFERFAAGIVSFRMKLENMTMADHDGCRLGNSLFGDLLQFFQTVLIFFHEGFPVLPEYDDFPWLLVCKNCRQRPKPMSHLKSSWLIPWRLVHHE